MGLKEKIATTPNYPFPLTDYFDGTGRKSPNKHMHGIDCVFVQETFICLMCRPCLIYSTYLVIVDLINHRKQNTIQK